MAIPVGTAVGYLTLDYTDFSKNLKTAVSEANQLSGKFADTLGSGLTTIGDQISSVGSRLTTAITLPLAAAAGASIKFGAEFDKGMSNVKAVSGATAEEFQEMRDAAIDWGEKTVYTATEASDALYYMGLAGWDANESVAALGPVLNLAAAGNLELGRTSDIVTDAMTALQISAEGYTNGVQNAEHFTNVLAATMANSNTDVDQLGEAFKYVAPLAGAAGIEAEDLSLALGLMANVGVKASQAGTSLRQALKSVISPTDKAAAVMDRYGVSLFNADGSAKDMRVFMDELRDTFGDLAVDVYDASGELKTAEQIMEEYGHSLPTSEQEKLNAIVQIFGTRALPGILGIIEQSDEKYNSLADAINGSDKAFVRHGDDLMTYQEAVDQFGESLVNTSDEFEILGFSAGMAETQMDNLQGDWTKLTSALGTTQIEITDLVNGALRELVQKITELVTWFNDLDDEQQSNILKWLAVAAAIGPALLIFGKTVSTIGHLFTAFNNIKKALTLVRTGFSLVSSVLGPTVGAFRNLFTTLGPLKGTLSLIQTALAGISLPMVAIVAVVALLVGSFVHLMKTNEEFRDKIMGIWDGIKAKFEEAGQKILDAINEMGFNFDSLTEALKAGFDWLSNVLAPFFLGLLDTISFVIGGALDIIVGIFEIVGGLFKGFREGDWSMFTQGLSDFFGGLFELISTPFTLAFNIITRILETFGLTWTEVWDGIKRFFYNIAMTIIMKINEIKYNITTWWEETKAGFFEFHQNLWNAIGDFLYNIVMSVIRFVADIKYKISEFVENIHNKFTEMKLKVIGKVLEMIVDITEKFYQIKSTIEMVVSTILRIVTNKFNEMKLKVVQKVNSMKNDIINTFSNIKEKFTQIGSNIIQGIAKGIDDGWQWLKDKVSNLASSLLDTAKDALGISSPSKAFEDDFGYWLPLGAVEGVEDSMPKAIDQIQSAFDNGLSQITGEVNLDSSFDGMIYSVQDAIEEVTVWFESIEDRLINAATNIRDTLTDIVDTGNSVVTPEGFILDTGKSKPSDSLDLKRGGTSDTSETGNVTNNYYYTFNSPKAIDEIEASRKFKETQRDLSEGF